MAGSEGQQGVGSWVGFKVNGTLSVRERVFSYLKCVDNQKNEYKEEIFN